MIKSRFWIAMLLLFILIAGSACQKRPADSGQDILTKLPGGDSEQLIQAQLAENLSIDAEIASTPAAQKLNTYLVSSLKLDSQVQKLKERLIAESKIVESGHPGEVEFFRTTEGNYLAVGANYVRFDTSYFQPYVSQLLFKYVIPGDTTYNLDHIQESRDLDLPFMKRSQAEAEVKKILTEVGISVHDDVETYALDSKALQALEQSMKEKGDLTSPRDGSIVVKEQWSEEDSIYYMIFRTDIDTIPVYNLEHGSVESNTLVMGSSIYAAYSSRGVEYLDIHYPYEKKAVAEETLPIISVKEALASVTNKYANIILTEPTIITAVEFCYVPTLNSRSREEFRMVPAWVFELEEHRTIADESYLAHSRMIVDATTGGEIL
ncbi:hypothetical protein DesLBE_5322 [Desulfitobacterium sp. LBE]|uniref:hypothetical protein n=1 Tax=Desulfitobacterium sp. LBE TaxID=884086 RepID=UPI00119A3EAD|nr:hypothetical protein [Desulfitobacterium sp. LBE]TWH60868.1 hypothetical protein DesLBE_5322 [Desulfitobacterium sp. LBE]